MPTRTRSVADAASEHLMFVSGYVHRLLQGRARRLGIRWSGLMVLVDLDLLGPLEQRTLVEIEQVRPSTMTVLLQDLEAKGWIARATHATDARVTQVTITPPGRAELRRAGVLLRERLNEELTGVPRDVLQRVAQALEPLSAALRRNVRPSSASRGVT